MTPPDPHVLGPLAFFLEPIRFVCSPLIKKYLLIVLVFIKFACQSMCMVSAKP